jgi:hypothetical protein
MVSAKTAHSNQDNFQYANKVQSQMTAEVKFKKNWFIYYWILTHYYYNYKG